MMMSERTQEYYSERESTYMKNRFSGTSPQAFENSSHLGLLLSSPSFIRERNPGRRYNNFTPFSAARCSSLHIFYRDTLSHASSHIVIASKA